MVSSWTLDNPPNYAKDSVMTKRGWEKPAIAEGKSPEVLVSIRNGSSRASAADVVGVTWIQETLVRGENMGVMVQYNEKVDVPAGSSVVVTAAGGASNVTLYAEEQLDTEYVVYDKLVDTTTAATVADIAAVYSVGAQTIGNGTIIDAANKVAARGTLTFTGQPANNETVTIDGKAYVFQTTLTNVDGHVKIGGDVRQSIDNLVAAINLGAGAGTKYAAGTTLHSTVSAVAGAGTTIVATAKTGGSAGNSLATTDTVTLANWAAVTLLSGAEVSSNKAITSGQGTACGTRTVVAGALTAIAFGAGSYVEGAAISVTATFAKAVDVTVGAGVIVHDTDSGGDFTLYAAAAQTNTTTVVFDKIVDNTTGATVPLLAGTMSIPAQTISGTIREHGTTISAIKIISSAMSTAAGTRVVISHGNIASAAFGASSYEEGDPLTVSVTYDESVDVPAGAAIVVATSGVATDITLKAAAQTAVTVAVFNKAANGTDAAVVPVEAGTLSISAQTLSGSIVDTGTVTAADKTITADIATAVGTRVVPTHGEISSLAFGAGGYVKTAPLTFTLTYDDAVDVTAGASIVVSWSGVGGNFTMKAAAQTNVTAVVFNKASDGTTPATVPNEGGTLSFAAQTVGGTIKDHGQTRAAVVAISGGVAAGAGTRVVAP